MGIEPTSGPWERSRRLRQAELVCANGANRAPGTMDTATHNESLSGFVSEIFGANLGPKPI
jgi:hypothetical protein